MDCVYLHIFASLDLGKQRTIQTLEGNLDDHLLLVEFAYNNSHHASIGMPPYEALYGRKCRTPLYWDEDGEQGLLGQELVQQIADVVKTIQARLVAAQDGHKKYADLHRQSRDFEVSSFVFLKVSPLKEKIRFSKKRKLSPRFIRPFKVLKKVSEEAYQVALPPELEHIHNIFHVFMLRPYKPDYKYVISYEPIQVEKNLTYEETPVQC